MIDLEFQHLYDESLLGYALLEAIMDSNENPLDYIIIKTNVHFYRLLGLEDQSIIKKKLSLLLSNVDFKDFDWIQTLNRALLFKKVVTVDLKLNNEKFRIRAFTPKRGLVVIYYKKLSFSHLSLL